jgi:hypothetical protein
MIGRDIISTVDEVIISIVTSLDIVRVFYQRKKRNLVLSFIRGVGR